jgi:redox-sensitive bicupin YhaK (pirin superfamily)
MTLLRTIEEVLQARSASDGDGVKLKRVFGGPNLARFDPFLMLDEFGSDEAADYIGGFPAHPHRGFETITYMLNGHMEHRDHMNNIGKLGPGDVQWMKAGSGVVHSEMPQQEEGLMRGFQLWLNLPAAEKMTPATYNDIAAQDIPNYEIDNVSIKAIAGQLSVNGKVIAGRVTGLTTDPSYLDVAFAQDSLLTIDVPAGYSALVYFYEGEGRIGDQDYLLKKTQLARLSDQGELAIHGAAGSKLLVITGKPIKEPIVQHGPFVMNSVEEIQTAMREYSDGTFV